MSFSYTGNKTEKDKVVERKCNMELSNFEKNVNLESALHNLYNVNDQKIQEEIARNAGENTYQSTPVNSSIKKNVTFETGNTYTNLASGNSYNDIKDLDLSHNNQKGSNDPLNDLNLNYSELDLAGIENSEDEEDLNKTDKSGKTSQHQNSQQQNNTFITPAKNPPLNYKQKFNFKIEDSKQDSLIRYLSEWEPELFNSELKANLLSNYDSLSPALLIRFFLDYDAWGYEKAKKFEKDWSLIFTGAFAQIAHSNSSSLQLILDKLSSLLSSHSDTFNRMELFRKTSTQNNTAMQEETAKSLKEIQSLITELKNVTQHNLTSGNQNKNQDNLKTGLKDSLQASINTFKDASSSYKHVDETTVSIYYGQYRIYLVYENKIKRVKVPNSLENEIENYTLFIKPFLKLMSFEAKTMDGKDFKSSYDSIKNKSKWTKEYLLDYLV